MTTPRRGPWLTTAAILFALLAISNATKPLQIGGARTGFVFFGERLSGTPNLIVGPIFGVFLAVYALAIWRMRRVALPLAWAYAAYVVVNLALFRVRTPQPPGADLGVVFGLAYAAVAIGTSAGTAIVLTRRARELR
jgi:hypothetical protein